MDQLRQGHVVDCLKRERRTWTLDEIYQACRVNVREDKALQSLLKANPRVLITKDQGRVLLSYRPQAEGVTNAHELLQDLVGRPMPVDRSRYTDAYAGVQADLQRLIQEQRLVCLTNDETKEQWLYVDLPSLHQARPDADVKRVAQMVMPPPKDLHAYLRDHGLPVCVPPIQRKVATSMLKKRKRAAAKGLRVTTNEHMGQQWVRDTAQNSFARQ